jgi:hypothetical protein
MATVRGMKSIRNRDEWGEQAGRLPALRIFGRGGTYAPAPEEGRSLPMRRPWTTEDYGHPSCQFRAQGFPLEVRVWKRRPPPGIRAVRHPSGVWLAIRTV